MAEALKTFREGEDILASETNENNQFLLSKLSDNAAQVQNYVEGEVVVIKSNIASVQATLQNNIDEIKERIYIVETFREGTSGYRIWSDGYCEQWGLTDVFVANPIKVTYRKVFDSDEHNILFTPRGTNIRGYAITISAYSSTGFSANCGYGTNEGVSSGAGANCMVGWKASGYLAEGEY